MSLLSSLCALPKGAIPQRQKSPRSGQPGLFENCVPSVQLGKSRHRPHVQYRHCKARLCLFAFGRCRAIGPTARGCGDLAPGVVGCAGDGETPPKTGGAAICRLSVCPAQIAGFTQAALRLPDLRQASIKATPLNPSCTLGYSTSCGTAVPLRRAVMASAASV